MTEHLLQRSEDWVWAWTAVEITTAHDVTKVADLVRLDPGQRLEHAVRRQRAHLDRLLSLDPGEVVALRILGGGGPLRIVLLGRTYARDEAAARARADALAARLAEITVLVDVRPLTAPSEVHAVLAPFPTSADGVAQIGKRTRTVTAARADAGVARYVAVEPFARQITDWSPLLAALWCSAQPVALTVALSPQPVPPALRSSLEREALRLARVVRPEERVADLGGRIIYPADAAAAILQPVVADALDRYTDRAFRFAVILASPRALDPVLVEAVGAVLSGRREEGAARHDEQAVTSSYVIRTPRDAHEARRLVEAVGGLDPVMLPDYRLEQILASDADTGRRALSELHTLVDTAEAASLFRLPVALDGTLPGFPVRTPPDRHQVLARAEATTSILLGHQAGDRSADAEVRIAAADLARHAFIVGTPGSGKTNSALHLCTELWDRKIPFLVVEPANTTMNDYRWLATRRGFEDLLVLTVGDESLAPLRLNPFEVPLATTVGAHVSNLLACFEAAFGLWDPLPFLFRRALVRTYRRRGFHPDDRGTPAVAGSWPILSEFVEVLTEVTAEPGWVGEVGSNIDASARLRAEALAEGACATTLDCRRSHDIGQLLRRPVVIELAGVGDNAKEQALVTLLLITAIRGYRRSGPAATATLHVLFLEEAHRVFPRSRPTSSGEAKEADARALAAERIAQGLAEDRKYNQGYLLIDQQVGAVAEDAYKITNLKLMHRTAAEEDRTLLGSTMSMHADQIASATALAPFDAFVSHNGLDRAVAVRVPDVRAEDARSRGLDLAPLAEDDELRRRYRALSADPAFADALAPYEECVGCSHRCSFRRRAQSVMAERRVGRQLIDTITDEGWDAGSVRLRTLAADGELDEQVCLVIHAFRAIHPPGKWEAEEQAAAHEWAEDARTELARIG